MKSQAGLPSVNRFDSPMPARRSRGNHPQSLLDGAAVLGHIQCSTDTHAVQDFIDALDGWAVRFADSFVPYVGCRQDGREKCGLSFAQLGRVFDEPCIRRFADPVNVGSEFHDI